MAAASLLSHKIGRFQSLPIYLTWYCKGIGVSQPSPNLGKEISDIPPDCQKLGHWRVLCQHLFSLGCCKWRSSEGKCLFWWRWNLWSWFLPWRKLLVDILGFQGNWNSFLISKIIHCLLPCIVQCFWHEEPWRGAEAADSAGNRLRRRQPKAGSPHSRVMPWETGICWILKLVGNRCQEPVSCREEIYLGWVQRVSDTQFAGYPRFLSTTVGCPCHLWRQGTQWSWCSAASSLISLKTLDPKRPFYFELRKNCDLALKVVGFSWSIQLNSCENVKARQGERGGWSTAAAPQGDFWLLNKAVILQMGESSQLLFLPSMPQHWKLCLSLTFLWIFLSMHSTLFNGFNNWFALISCMVFQCNVGDNPNGLSQNHYYMC